MFLLLNKRFIYFRPFNTFAKTSCGSSSSFYPQEWNPSKLILCPCLWETKTHGYWWISKSLLNTIKTRLIIVKWKTRTNTVSISIISIIIYLNKNWHQGLTVHQCFLERELFTNHIPDSRKMSVYQKGNQLKNWFYSRTPCEFVVHKVQVCLLLFCTTCNFTFNREMDFSMQPWVNLVD